MALSMANNQPRLRFKNSWLFRKEDAMATSAPPLIECDQVHAGLDVVDIPAAVEFYSKKLGFATAFTWGDPPTFAGVNLDKVQMFLRKGTPDPKGCFVSFMVGDADALYKFHRSQGRRNCGTD
jgi:hypothetical protein